MDLQILQAIANGNLNALREWICRLQSSEDANDRFTRVYLACISDASDEALNLLLDSGLVDRHAEDDINGRNCLHEAAIYGQNLVLRQGLADGVDVGRTDVYGRIPLHYACLKGRIDMVKILIEANDQTVNRSDHDNFTPLIHGIVRHRLACVQELLADHARIDPLTEGDHIPLNLACQHGSSSVAALLLQQGARLLPDAEGLYPQHVVARSSQSSDLLLLLKDYGADLNQKDKLYQWTPLFHAASEGRIEGLRTLLDNHVDMDILDEKGLSAMSYAAWEGHVECMEQLWRQSRYRPHLPSPSQVDAASGDVPLPKQTGGSSSERPDMTTAFNVTREVDSIPDLSLPPPIIPLRRYGHNFLENKTMVSINFAPGPAAIVFFNEGRYPAARITISSKLSDLIPRNVMLPIQEDSSNISFLVEQLSNFTIDFEVFPTFGSKVIAKSVALPDLFQDNSNSLRSCCLPLFDPRLRAIGQIRFRFHVIRPYHGDLLDIAHFGPYWKATSALDDQSGLVTGSSLSGNYLRIPVQLTRDKIPIVYPRFRLMHHGLEFVINQLRYDEIARAGMAELQSAEALLAKMRLGNENLPSSEEARQLCDSRLTLEKLLENLPPNIHLNIHLLFPTQIEERKLGLPVNNNLDTFADAVLTTVFDHARSSQSGSPEFRRSIVFSCKNPNLCVAVNWKQPNCKG